MIRSDALVGDRLREIRQKVERKAHNLPIWSLPPAQILIGVLSVFARSLHDAAQLIHQVPREQQQITSEVVSFMSWKWVEGLDAFLSRLLAKKPTLPTALASAHLSPRHQVVASEAFHFFAEFAEFLHCLEALRDGVCHTLEPEQGTIVFVYPPEGSADWYDYVFELAPPETISDQFARELGGELAGQKIDGYTVGEYGTVAKLLWEEAIALLPKSALVTHVLNEWVSSNSQRANLPPPVVKAILQDMVYRYPARSVELHPLIHVSQSQVAFVPMLMFSVNPVINAKRLWHDRYPKSYKAVFDRGFENAVRSAFTHIPDSTVKYIPDFRPVSPTGRRKRYEIDAVVWHPPSATLLVVEAYNPRPPGTPRGWRNLYGNLEAKVRSQVFNLLADLSREENLRALMSVVSDTAVPVPTTRKGLILTAFGSLAPKDHVCALTLRAWERTIERHSGAMPGLLDVVFSTQSPALPAWKVTSSREPIFLEGLGAISEIGARIGIHRNRYVFQNESRAP